MDFTNRRCGRDTDSHHRGHVIPKTQTLKNEKSTQNAQGEQPDSI